MAADEVFAMSHRSPTPLCLLLMLCCVIVLCYSPVLQGLDDFTVSQAQSLTTGLLALCVPVVARDWCLVYFVRIVRLIQRVGVRRVLVVALCVQGLGIMPYVVYSSVVHLGPQYINRLDRSATINWPLGRVSMYHSNDHYNHDLSEHIIPPGGLGIERNHHPKLYDSLWEGNRKVDHVERYSPEDVVLFCDIVIPTDTDVEGVTITMMWYKEEILEKQGKVVRLLYRQINQTTDIARITLTSQRAYISSAAAQTQPAGERLYAVTETLQLRRIKETDFGKYVCYAVVSFSMKQKGGFHKQDSLPTCRIELRKVTPKEQEVYIPPAGILYSIASFAQLDTNDDEILVERRINGQQAEELAQKSLCHPGFDLLVNFLDPDFVWLRGLAHSRLLTKKDHLMQTFVTDISNICIGDVMYGIHTFKIRREFYNTQTQTRDFEEVDYPRSLKVAPSFPYIFGDTQDSADFTYFSECWTKKGFINTDYCLKRQEHIDISIAYHVALDLLFLFLVVCLIPLLLLYWWYKLIRFVMHALLRDVFHGPGVACQAQPRHQTARRARAPRKACQGHVFLSYSAADSLVAQEIRCTLKAFSLSVFDCHADVPLGQPYIPAWDRAIERCDTFVVVVSPDYLADSLLQQIQLRCVLYPVFEDEVSEQRLLVVRVRDCPLPASLQPFPFVCEVTQRHWKRRLEWWALLTSFPSRQLVYVIRQAWRDIRRDVTDKGRGVWRNCQRHLRGNTVVRACVGVCMHLAKRPTRHRAVLGRHRSTETAEVNVEQAETTYAVTEDYDAELLYTPSSSKARERVTHQANADPHDVFLTYCEDSPHDCHVSTKIKVVLEGQGLRVFDAAKDVLGGQSETDVVTSASVCQSCVVVLSPAYIRHSLRRRLHFPLVLQGLRCGLLGEDSVLLVITPGTCSSLQCGSTTRTADTQGEGEGKRGETERVEYTQTEEDEEERDGVSDDVCENGIHVPLSLKSARRVQWSGNLSDDDHVTHITRWATATRRLLHRKRNVDLGILRQRYLERRGRALHRPMTLTSSGRFGL